MSEIAAILGAVNSLSGLLISDLYGSKSRVIFRLSSGLNNGFK
jgi:hypothetical protein